MKPNYLAPLILVLIGYQASVCAQPSSPARQKTYITGVRASASQKGHPPTDLLDANPDSRWAVQGTGQWLEITLSDRILIQEFSIGFSRAERTYSFTFEVPAPGGGWTTVEKLKSHGSGDLMESFAIPSVSCRKFRIVSFGSNSNDWINIHTIAIPSIEVAIDQRTRSSADLESMVARSNEAPQNGTTLRPLEFTRWSGTLNIPDPVAISFDSQGRAYVTQTQRRKSQDLDIRAHTSWIPDDVGFESVEDKRKFYRRVYATPRKGESRQRSIKDFNEDGVSDYRDLTAISEKIHMIEDTNGDGTADRINLFADGFQTEVTGIAAGVLWHDGAVYTTIAPDVWKLTDTTGDGSADEREIIATGFGLHIAYAGHDMHGLTVGPDGRIYWTVGDKGISVTSADGKKFHYPNQGGVMRCNPDGSNFEVFAHGLRNVQELAFDEFGNLFGVDNDADQPGERERVVYIVKGMDAGWRCNYQYRGSDYNPWTAEKLWNKWFRGQAAYITPPLAYSLNGPAGFTYNPGTALTPEYRGYFFLTGAPGGEQTAFRVKPSGASFEVINEQSIGRGIPLVGINFGPDGGLYGVDWGGGYPLNKKGAVWKIDVPNAANSAERVETKTILRNGFKDLPPETLLTLMGHADQRVRLGAQFELATRGAVAQLSDLATNHAALPVARRHAVWGLGQLLREKEPSSAIMSELLKDNSVDIVAQTLRVIADLPQFDGEILLPYLAHQDPVIRFHAAIALQRHTSDKVFDQLVQLAATLESHQTYLRHAFSFAFSGVKNPEQLVRLAQHESDMVRLTAVLGLRHRNDSYKLTTSGHHLSAFLNDTNSNVSTEAARAIYEAISRYGFHENSLIRQELASLASALESTPNMDEAFLRRAIGAAYLLGDKAAAIHVAKFTNRTDVPIALRLEAIDAIGNWNDPPKLDRVDGRRRRHAGSSRYRPDSEVSGLLAQMFNDSNDLLRAGVLNATRNLNVDFSDSDIQKLATVVDQSTASTELRIEALETLRSQKFADLPASIERALNSESAALRMRALEFLRHDEARSVEVIRAILSGTRETEERQHAVRSLAALKSELGDVYLEELFNQLLADSRLGGIELEVIESVRSRAKHHPPLSETLASFDETRSKTSSTDPLAEWTECLSGGRPENGRNTFMTHLTAACVRCHRVGSKGSTVGPNLESIGLKRDPRHLLRAIVQPSADIEPKYKTQTVLLVSGKVIQGLPVKRTDKETVLADSQGKEIRIKNDDIEESLEQKTSIMPDVTKVLTKREIRDLVAWLATLKTQPNTSQQGGR